MLDGYNKLPLYTLRANVRKTQKEVSEKLGVSRVTYASWENYKTFPDALQLIKLANIFKCSLDAFYFPDNASQKLAEETKQEAG